MGNPTTAQLLDAWEAARGQSTSRRPIAWLCGAFGWSRDQLLPMPLGERERLILQARQLLFGGVMPSITACQACGEKVEFSVRIASLLAAAKEAVEPLDVEGRGFAVVMRPLTSGDIEAVASASNPRTALFNRCLISGTYEDIEAAIAAAGNALADADPLAGIEMNLTCPECAAAFSVPFDPWGYFWEELNAWAIRTFQQVHKLAVAYGWTEAESLALTPCRRATYLAMVGS